MTPLGIIVQGLDDLHSALTAGTTVSDDDLARLDTVRALAAGLDPYIDRCTTAASAALVSLDEKTQAHDWNGFGSSVAAPTLEAEMLSGHVEGRFLQFLVGMIGATRVLEVGMFTGYSALAMAEALPPDGLVVACEIDPEVATFARDRFAESPTGDKIDVRVGPADETLRDLSGTVDAFDLVFIDADKAGYLDYVDLVLEGGLLAPGGTICVDNTLMQGQSYIEGERTANGSAIATFNDAVADDPRIEQVLLPIRDGVTLIRRAAR